MTNNKAREINSPVIKQLIDETNPEELVKIDAEMTNNKQQTAVEWYDNEIGKLFDQFLMGNIEFYEFQNQRFKLEQQAKEIEKEQIAKAFDDGDYNYHYSRKTGNDFEDGKEYFKEVYG
jgi:hypothetical protein